MTVPYYRDDRVTLWHGDCLDVLRTLPDNSVDAIVTDPPYGLAEHKRGAVEKALAAWLAGDRDHVPDGRGFMGREWDRFVPPPAVWDECFRVLKPGGHLLAFAGTRTVDLMGISIRLAGLTTDTSPEIRDSIAWLYGSGFPKSLDVSKAIDKAAGAAREVVGQHERPATSLGNGHTMAGGAAQAVVGITAPATPDAERWQGWGTALKPAFEPIVVARKPLAGTVAANVLQHGTGALNIDACRVATDDVLTGSGAACLTFGGQNARPYQRDYEPRGVTQNAAGRWAPNVVLDDSQAAELDAQTGTTRSRAGKPRGAAAGEGWGMTATGAEYDDEGGASRFFPTFRYEAKAPGSERPSYEMSGAGEGRVTNSGTTKVCRVCGNKTINPPNPAPACGHDDWERVPTTARSERVAHPTVKPLDLMRWLVRLVTPPGGTVLEPFAGSGTTIEACLLEGFDCIAIERGAEYLPLIIQRISKPLQGGLFSEVPA